MVIELIEYRRKARSTMKQMITVRRAFTMIEILIAVVLLSALITAFAQFSMVLQNDRRQHAMRVAAQQELENVADQIMHVPYSEIEKLPETFPLSKFARNALNEPELRISRIIIPGERATMCRIDFSLQWKGHTANRMSRSIWRTAVTP